MLTRIPNRYKKPGYFLILLLFLQTFCFAQPIELQAEMELNFGLKHNSVRSIIQDSLNRTILGTESGMVVLESHDPYLDTISSLTENLAIVSMNRFGNLLFIGTVANGLKIFNLDQKHQVRHPILDSIRYVRRIRKFGDTLYIAANASSWKVSYSKGKLLMQKIHRPVKKGFFTDFVSYDGKIFAYDIKAEINSRVFQVHGTYAMPAPYPRGFPPNPIFSFLTGLGNDSIMINAGDGFYNLIQKGKKAEFHLLKDSQANLLFPVWDVTLAKQKIFLALGQQFQLKMGLTYEAGVNSIKDIRNDFFAQSLYYNPTHDALWIGTYNRGLFVWPNVSLSNRIPASVKGVERVVNGGNGRFYIHNKRNLYSWSAGKDPVRIWDKSLHDSLVRDILHVERIQDTLAVMRTNSLMFFDKQNKLINAYPFYPNQFGQFRQLGDTIFFFTLHNTGVFAMHKETRKMTVLKDISIGVISRPYRNGFIFFSDEKGFYFHDAVTQTLKSPLTKIQEFEINGDHLWVLIAGRLIKYRINLATSTLDEEQQIVYTDLIKDFIPNWIRTSSGRIFVGNNKGLVQLDTASAKPIWYRYLGNYKSNLNPDIFRDTLLMVQDQYIEKHPLHQPYNESELKQFTLQLDKRDELFARFPVTLKVSHTDYFLQRYVLKRLELETPDGQVKTLFSLGNGFEFPSGLTAGRYKARLFVNGIEVKQLEFKVTVPLLQNPWFYTVAAAFIIMLFYQLFRYRAKKQELESSMLENRLQLLKKNLDPHFIFNSLNLTYMLLLQENNKEAIDSIMRFSDLHRYFLETINKKEIALTEELKFIQNYLDLEQKRVHLDAPFAYTIDAYDPGASGIMIPPMILHPLVENAVKYCGFDPDKHQQAQIQIGLIFTPEQVVIRIENTLGKSLIPEGTGFQKGVEIVRETIAIHNKMRQHQIDFYPNLPSRLFQPGFRCEVVVKY